MAKGGSTVAVFAAIIGNFVVMLAKFAAAYGTGSDTLFSEGIHSTADTLNQILLAIGIWSSQRPASPDHPYGHDLERFIWAMISAVGIFFLGFGVTAYHGVSSLFHHSEMGNSLWAFIVLAFSFIVEGIVLIIAVRAVQKDAAGKPLFAYLRKEADPPVVAIVLEDSIAVLGVLIAAIAIALNSLTGNAIWDAIGSILIAILLGFAAVVLVAQNRRFLIGVAIPVGMKKRVLDVVNAQPSVEAVYDFKSRMLSIDKYRIKMEVEFEGRLIAQKLEGLIKKAYPEIKDAQQFYAFCEEFADQVIDTLGDEVDRIEDEIRKKVPAVAHVDIETD
jgi:solute carrier family 30 (zinc transporter), member 9